MKLNLKKTKTPRGKLHPINWCLCEQIRSVLELAVPAWHSCLTLTDRNNIERVQRAALQVIFGSKFNSYSSACELAGLSTLEERRNKLCRKFALKAAKHPNHSKWFKINEHVGNTRQKQPPYCPVISRTTRFENSPISYITKLLNKNISVKWRPTLAQLFL